MDKFKVRKLIDELEAEINNGGFDQFFFNSAGDNTAETIAALRAVGANHTAAIVAAAASKFPNGMAPTSRDLRQELLESVSPDSDAFGEQDQEFLAYKDNLSALVSAYAG
jgi:hypothetical protein